MQSEYNIFQNGFDQDLVDKVKKEVTSFWGWGTFDKGIISGRVDKERTFEKDDCRSWAPWWKKSNKNQKIELMEKIFNKIESKDGVSLALAHAELSELKVKPIVGVKSLEQLNGVQRSYQKLGTVFPRYHQIMEEFFHD